MKKINSKLRECICKETLTFWEEIQYPQPRWEEISFEGNAKYDYRKKRIKGSYYTY